MQDRYHEFTILISKIARSIKQIKAKSMKDFELNGSHCSCIYYLYQKGPLTVRQLTEVCDEDKGLVSRSLSYLEEHKFVVSEISKKKIYKIRHRLTPKGREIGEIIHQKALEVLSLSDAGLSEEELENVYRCLSIIERNLHHISQRKSKKIEE